MALTKAEQCKSRRRTKVGHFVSPVEAEVIMRLRGYGQALWRRWYLHLVLKDKWGFDEDREGGRCSTKREQYRQAKMWGDLMKFFFCYLCWHSTHSLKSLSSGCSLSVCDNIHFPENPWACCQVLWLQLCLILQHLVDFLILAEISSRNGQKDLEWC